MNDQIKFRPYSKSIKKQLKKIAKNKYPSVNSLLNVIVEEYLTRLNKEGA